MKFLINRTDAIGDLALTLPIAPYIKEKYPDCEITFIVSVRNVQLMEYAGLVDKYWVYDKNINIFARIFNAYKEIKGSNPDYYLYAGGSHVISFVAWLCRIKNRGGLLSRFASFLFLNKGMRQPRSLAVMHESEYNFNLLNPFGFNYHFKDKEKYFPRVAIAKSLSDKVCAFFIKELHLNIDQDDYIVIHPGMTGHTLNWPILSYARLVRLIEKKYPKTFCFIISYTHSDLELINQIKNYFLQPDYKDFGQKIYYYDGGLRGLGEYMALLKNAKYFIGPSTGPTHLANLLKVPLISLYSPIKTQSAVRWGPFYKNNISKVIVPDVVCGEDKKCSLEKCPYYPCMSKIEVDDIIDNISDVRN